MNRIILIGNGFDLAHGMKTSYGHFVDDYWKNTIDSIKNMPQAQRRFENDELVIENLPDMFDPRPTFQDLKDKCRHFNINIKFKNVFLELITNRKDLEKWVDIENEYYSLLKRAYSSVALSQKPYDINSLNSDFSKIKELLKDYLTKVEKEFDENISSQAVRIKAIIGNKIYTKFKMQDFSESSLNKKVQLEFDAIKNDLLELERKNITMDDLNTGKANLIREIGFDINQAPRKLKELLLSEGLSRHYFDLTPQETLFLNFNYTFTEALYSNPKRYDDVAPYPKSIHIHGTIGEHDGNPMIFGFGDELDDEYKTIEKLEDNRYLENIKSINYLETDNYKSLLEFVNSGSYQIFIMGHSCGTSDRTLLNTLFEHENCASIKVFYHQKSESNDNYSDIVRNISRNFNDKALMRDRVVNKTYCQPLG